MTNEEADEILFRLLALHQQLREARQEMRQATDEIYGPAESQPETPKSQAGGVTVEITIRIKIEEKI